MGRELLAAVERSATDPAIRAVAISGSGSAFSSGADLTVERELTPHGDPDLSVRLLTIYNPIIEAITTAPKPVVASVQGAAAGLGCSLALACDLVIAEESAFFMLPFVRIGLVPDAGALVHTAARIGLTRAAEMALRGRRVKAEEAFAWGLINQVTAVGELGAETDKLLAELANGPTVALANAKRLLRSGALAGLADQLAHEARTQQLHATTDDYAEGVAAFREKRRAEYKGR